MLKHPDPEVQFLVEMLESQRDQAVAQAAAYFCMVQKLQQQIDQPVNEDQKIGGTD
jgi:hypothetical protein